MAISDIDRELGMNFPPSFSEPVKVDDDVDNLERDIMNTPVEEEHKMGPMPVKPTPSDGATVTAHVLSWVLSPVLMPTYGIILVFFLSVLSYAPIGVKATIVAIVFTLTALIPGLAVWLMTRFGDVKDVALTRRKDRAIPYIIMILCMTGCGFYLSTTGLPEWIPVFYIGGAAAGIVNLIINNWWKISAHGAGIGGLIGMLVVMNRYGMPHFNLWIWTMGTVLAAGCLGTARVWLGRHTALQTICGTIVGFLGVFLLELYMM